MASDLMRNSVLNFKAKLSVIHLLALLSLTLQTPGFFGEDIVNARNNYLTGDRTDFWGGISTLIYAHVPNFGFRWQIWLAIFQILLTTIGLSRTLSFDKKRKINYLLNLLIAYSALVFGSQMTRDGLMFSLLVFGYSELTRTLINQKEKKFFVLPVLVISLALSFRPWLSLAIVPIALFAMRRFRAMSSKSLSLLVVIFIVLTPLAIETLAKESLELKRSYPEQQVMLMDTAATYCYSSNLNSGLMSKSTLALFSSDPRYTEYACQLYRPDTWVSLTQSINASSQGFQVEFSLIKPNETDKYQELRSAWIKTIFSDPVTYLQNKILFAIKIAVASETRGLSIISANSASTKAMALFRIPFEIALTLHLYSLLALLLILFFNPIKNFCLRKRDVIMIDKTSVYLILSIVLWTTLSSIAYIGSNGRYTYALTILSLIVYASRNRNVSIR
jgi:hypothetical protein